MTITVAFGTSTPTSITVVATSTSISPARNAAMIASRSLAGTCPCISAEPQPVQMTRFEFVVGFDGRRRLDLVGALDQRAHHVRLTPGRDLFAHHVPRDGLFELAPRPGSDDRRAAGRQLVEHRDVEVAVDRHRRRARDRRRGHHQHVGVVALAPQRGALLDAEAVLLVDHGHAELGERDALGDQRVRADDDVDLASGETGADLLAFGSCRPPGQQLDAQAGGLRTAYPPLDGTVVSASSARTPSACCSASTSVGAISAPW